MLYDHRNIVLCKICVFLVKYYPPDLTDSSEVSGYRGKLGERNTCSSETWDNNAKLHSGIQVMS